jgi:hypothetical protein
MTSFIVSKISLQVGRAFKSMLVDPSKIDFIEIDIPQDIFDYQFDELIHILEVNFRLDFFDKSTNGWYSIPRNKGFRQFDPEYIKDQKLKAKSHKRGKRRKVDKPTIEQTNKSTVIEEISEFNIIHRLRQSKKLRVDVQRTFDNPVPVIPTDYSRSMKHVADSNEIEKNTLYQKRC